MSLTDYGNSLGRPEGIGSKSRIKSGGFQNFWDRLTGKDNVDSTNYTNLQMTEDTNDANVQMTEDTNAANREIADSTNQTNKDIADQNLQFQIDQAEYEKALQEKIFQREDTSYERTAKDMSNAGLSVLSMNGTDGVGDTVSKTVPQNDFQSQIGSPMVPGMKQAPQFIANPNGEMNAFTTLFGGISSIGSLIVNNAMASAEIAKSISTVKNNHVATKLLNEQLSALQKNNTDLFKNFGGLYSFEHSENIDRLMQDYVISELHEDEATKRLGYQQKHEKEIQLNNIKQQRWSEQFNYIKDLTITDKELNYKYTQLSQDQQLAYNQLLSDWNKIIIQNNHQDSMQQADFEHDFQMLINQHKNELKEDAFKGAFNLLNTVLNVVGYGFVKSKVPFAQ